MNIKAFALTAVVALLAIGLVAAQPRTSAQTSAAAPRPAPVRTVIGGTVPMPDFFGSMLITR